MLADLVHSPSWRKPAFFLKQVINLGHGHSGVLDSAAIRARTADARSGVFGPRSVEERAVVLYGARRLVSLIVQLSKIVMRRGISWRNRHCPDERLLGQIELARGAKRHGEIHECIDVPRLDSRECGSIVDAPPRRHCGEGKRQKSQRDCGRRRAPFLDTGVTQRGEHSSTMRCTYRLRSRRQRPLATQRVKQLAHLTTRRASA